MKTRSFFWTLGLYVLVCHVALPATAQKLLPPNGSVQSVTHLKLYYGGDTVFGDFHYQQVRYTKGDTFNFAASQFVLGLREDTLEMKVYAYTPYTQEEVQIYDFGVQVGGTVNRLQGSDPYVMPHAFAYQKTPDFDIVSSIDSTWMFGKMRKRINYRYGCQCMEAYHTCSIIEGVGHVTHGFIWPAYECIADVFLPKLLCIHDKNGGQEYARYPGTPCYIPIQTSNFPITRSSLAPFSPNPVKDRLQIDAGVSVTHYELVDLQGRGLGRQACRGQEIDISTYPPGTYIFRLWFQGQSEASNYKLLKEPSR